MERAARDRDAEQDAERAAHRADPGRLGELQPRELAGGDAGRPQVRQLRPLGQRCLRLQREDQEAAGQQRDQRQHIQVHPVGTAQVGKARGRGIRSRDHDAGRQRQPLVEVRHGGAGREAQRDPREAPEPTKAPLREAQVHHAQQCAGFRARHRAAHLQPHVSIAGVDLEVVAWLQAQALEGGWRQVDAVLEGGKA